MKLTIETENPAEIAQIIAALAGTAPATVAAKADKPKAEKPLAAPATSANTEPTQTMAVNTPPPPQPTQPAAVAEIPDEAALTAAANAAIAKLGPGAQGKIKEYIGTTYQKDDGSPAGLRTVKVEQRAALLADLNAFASGARVI